MEHRIKCSAWNKVLAYIRVKLTDILLRFNITSSYIFRIFLQNQDNVMHGYSFYPRPNDSKFSILIFCRLSVDHGTGCRQRSSPFGTR